MKQKIKTKATYYTMYTITSPKSFVYIPLKYTTSDGPPEIAQDSISRNGSSMCGQNM